ncbi:class I SAM-dependent methyltransferase [Fervidibacillus halotolerans]|uniref:Class I SAM-dependent methyltransferase n=1 Tax=Fervidibacillus halotolerans TaxID=2980027 RepID=A0A9E8M2F7_9BACI|nr:class I SAM-dependent methyltransferase [Fervidibacillus halotolerans]WAA13164.1 class I SAM-dependent methyltransferase [Fervidibacillus halotolerans]
MLDKNGFDQWAVEYDLTVRKSEEGNSYPFAGYERILQTIYEKAMEKRNSKILDIGFGTGQLTTRLYKSGQRIYGIDFSRKMISIAKEKMPEAHLIEWDLSMGLPDVVKEHRYDTIISTYTLHHFTDEKKISLLKEFLSLLTPDGKILIGDIAFKSRKQLEMCRMNHIAHWDDEEYYFVIDELKPAFNTMGNFEFIPISYCGGVLVISK